MEKSVQQYKQAVRVIKDAILYSQYRAAKLVPVNSCHLTLVLVLTYQTAHVEKNGERPLLIA